MKKIYTPLLLLALALIACQEGNITPEAHVVSDEMSFNVLVPGLQTKVADNAFETSDVIGLYVTDYADETTPMPLQVSGNRANNSIVTFDGVSWTPEHTIYWGEGKSDVYAYYPYIETVADVNNLYFEVAADQTGEGYEMSDFLWAKAEGVRQTVGAVRLEMKHIMSKLTVKIVAGEDYVGSLPEDALVHLHSTVTNANINLEAGSVVKDPYSGAKSIKMKKLGVRTFDGEKAVVYEAIVVPQMLENSVPLLEINSKSVSYLLEDPFNFRPGVAYTYTATLNTSTTAIKVEIGCELEDWNGTGGSSGEGEEGGDGSGEDEDGKIYNDLSAAGTANCYLIQSAGYYKFKSVIGNSDATVGNIKTVEVLWESFGTDEMPNVGDLIASVSYKDGYVHFSTPENFRDGNAVIAAKNSKGTILWSWHIWCAEEGWTGQVYANDAGTMMDRNLGATSATPGEVGALGLLYQWGRKDPFLGSSSIYEGVEALSTGVWQFSSEYLDHNVSIVNPMTFYGGFNGYNTQQLMKVMYWSSIKTAYDPCPAGWRVPDGGESGVWNTASFSNFIETNNETYPGHLFDTCVVSEKAWYPASGYRQRGGMLCDVGWNGTYWSCTTSDYEYAPIYNFMFAGPDIYTYEQQSVTEARVIRCQKEMF